jgi:uncharacterized membrane protein YqaE (UPF0057 family)
MLGAALRAILLGLCGGLIEKGIWTTGQVEQLALGLAGFFATVVWILWIKYKDRLHFDAALQTPAGTTESEIRALVKRGELPQK